MESEFGKEAVSISPSLPFEAGSGSARALQSRIPRFSGEIVSRMIVRRRFPIFETVTLCGRLTVDTADSGRRSQ